MNFDKEIIQGLKIAEQKWGGCDLLIDIFDLTIAWMNEKTAKSAGKRIEDYIDKPVIDVTFLSSEEYANLVRRVMNRKDIPVVYRVPVKVSDEKTFIYEASHYPISLTDYPRFIAVKILQIEE